MKLDNAWNMFVFRDGRRSVPGATLARELAEGLRQWPSRAPARRELVINLLLRAGELECALADASSDEASRCARLTDLLASALVAPEAGACSSAQLVSLLPLEVPDQVQISPPEGFAYYALHPLDFAALVQRIDTQENVAGVIGIRSIGSTLSAIVAAALRRRGVRADRISVRPVGHPYNRRTQFSDAQLQWVAAHRSHWAEFFVVDEGPGMSGSSFLSVGDELLSAGVSRNRIAFLCSRVPDPERLRAREAAQRWPAFRSYYVTPNPHLPAGAEIYAGGGTWREHIYSDPGQWPASWIHMERLKFLSADKRTLFKFEGFGRFGNAVKERAQVLADQGYSVAPLHQQDGFGWYPLIAGRPLCYSDLNRAVLDRMAEYCAFRTTAVRSADGQSPQQMASMVQFNIAEEFGIEHAVDAASLYAENSVIVDGRMLPHEWVGASDGRLLKVDAGSHGDDHFFPGPTDIAWDLAGAIVEWEMNARAQECLIERFRECSGDDPRRRLPAFILAYAVFRFAYCKMAAAAVAGTGEEHRLAREHDRYRHFVSELLRPSANLIAA
jgi:hypothetical protein